VHDLHAKDIVRVLDI